MRALLLAGALAVGLPVMAEDRLTNLPPADIVILGEVHDNPRHHDWQALALRHLSPRAVVWEMLTPEQAARLPDDLGDASAVDAAIGWTGSGWPEFALYHPLFLAAPQALHLGAAVPRDELRRVFDEPLAQVFGADAPRFGLDADLPEPERAAREAEMMAAHCDALPESMMPGMLASQRLRDGAMARAALAALQATGGPVAIIAGHGHARTDHGIPSLIARAAPDVAVLSVGLLEGEPDSPPPFDLWLTTDPPERDDPCAAFR